MMKVPNTIHNSQMIKKSDQARRQTRQVNIDGMYINIDGNIVCDGITDH